MPLPDRHQELESELLLPYTWWPCCREVFGGRLASFEVKDHTVRKRASRKPDGNISDDSQRRLRSSEERAGQQPQR